MNKHILKCSPSLSAGWLLGLNTLLPQQET